MRAILIIITLLFPISLLNSQNYVWTKIDENRYFNGPREMNYFCFDCSDSNNCITVGIMATIMNWNRVTTDKGKTWFSSLQDSGTVDTTYGYKTYDPSVDYVVYPDTNLCLIFSGAGLYYKSTNKCSTWTTGRIKIAQAGIMSASFTKKKIGCWSIYSELFLTEDGGDTWSNITTNFPDTIKPFIIGNLAMPSENAMVLICYKSDFSRYLLRSDDRGNTWRDIGNIDSTKSFRTLFFIDEQHGWLAGGRQLVKNETGWADQIYYTSDGGNTWETQLDTVISRFYSIYKIKFCDKNNGIALGTSHNVLWRTIDGGKHWILDELIHGQIESSLIDFYMFSHNDILASTFDLGQIYRYGAPDPSEVSENLSRADEIKIYPNLITEAEKINIEIPDNKLGIKLFLYDYTGNIVESRIIEKIANNNSIIQYQIDTNLPNGLYWLKIVNGKEVWTKKLIKL